MPEKILLLGGGGHCQSLIDVIESGKRYAIAGIVDKKEFLQKQISGYQVIGTDEDLPALIKEYRNCLIAVGQIKSSEVRMRLYMHVRKLNAVLPVVSSCTAYMSSHATIGEGTAIMHHSLVNTFARIGANCIINSASVIEHHATIGEHSHVSTGAIVNGECVVGNNCFIGSNAVIANGVHIAHHNIIAAGAVVIENTEPNGLYAGNPAILKKKLE